MAKRGLIVTYYFPPCGGGGVQRWTKFIKYLTAGDWKLTVITTHPEAGLPRDPSLLSEIPSSVKILRTGDPDAPLAYLKRGKPTYWKRWLSAWLHITDSRRGWNRIVNPLITEELDKNSYDLILFTAPPYSLAELAAQYARKSSIPVVMDLRDPWTTNPYKIYPTALHRRLDRRREKETLTQIPHIISVYKTTARYLESRLDRVIKVIPNGYDEADFSALKSRTDVRRGALNIAFSGTFYSHLNTPWKLFEAVRVLKQQGEDVHFHHIGTSVPDLKAAAAKLDIADRVHLWGYQDHQNCLEMLAAMDATCLILDSYHRHATDTVGGKFYEYLRLKKPVLALVPESGEAAEMIRESGAGVVCPRQEADAIGRCILEIKNGTIDMPFRNIDRYKRSNLAEEMNRYLESLISQSQEIT